MVATVLAALLSFLSTLLGGLASLQVRNKLQLVLGFTAGVLLGIVAFDLLPEIMALVQKTRMNPRGPMIALVAGFLLFHIMEKAMLLHHARVDRSENHRLPSLGLLAALCLSIHSFFDGVGIGLGFQISSTTGTLISLAMISHDFADGLNTGSLMMVHGNTPTKTIMLILADATAPGRSARLPGILRGVPSLCRHRQHTDRGPSGKVIAQDRADDDTGRGIRLRGVANHLRQKSAASRRSSGGRFPLRLAATQPRWRSIEVPCLIWTLSPAAFWYHDRIQAPSGPGLDDYFR
jgi:ZIP family zinc transporter